MPRTVLLLHSSAGLYGADVQLEAIARGLDPAAGRRSACCPSTGPLVRRLEQAGAEVVVHPLAVLRRAQPPGRGVAAMARAVRHDRRLLGALARERDVAVVHDNTSVVLGGGAVARAARAAHVVHVREIWTGGGRAERALWPLMRRRMLRADALAGNLPGRVRPVPARGGRPAARRPGASRPSWSTETGPGRRSDCPPTGSWSPWWAACTPGRARTCWPARWPSRPWPASAPWAWWRATRSRAVMPGRPGSRWPATWAWVARLLRLGFRDDVDTVLSAADALAVPSTRPEPLGLVALEAGAAGLPVVASARRRGRRGGARRRVRPAGRARRPAALAGAAGAAGRRPRSRGADGPRRRRDRGRPARAGTLSPSRCTCSTTGVRR